MFSTLIRKPARAFFIHPYGILTGRSLQAFLGVSPGVAGLIFNCDQVIRSPRRYKIALAGRLGRRLGSPWREKLSAS